MSRFHQQTARSGHTHHSPPCPSSSWWHVAAESLDTIDNVKVSNPRAGVFPSLPCPSSSWWHVPAESSDTIDNVKVSPANSSKRSYPPLSTLSFVFVLACSCQNLQPHRQH